MAKTKLYQWPPPVYVARFAGGEECRMSVSSTIKGQYGFDRARSIACAVIGNERGRAMRPRRPAAEIDKEIADRAAKDGARSSRGRGSVSPFYPSMEWTLKNFPPADDIMAGHFEHDGAVIPDPFFTGGSVAKPKALDKLIASLNKLSADELAALSAEVDTRLLQAVS